MARAVVWRRTSLSLQQALYLAPTACFAYASSTHNGGAAVKGGDDLVWPGLGFLLLFFFFSWGLRPAHAQQDLRSKLLRTRQMKYSVLYP